jgi:superoxide dismutase, Cu-Zn family
MAHSALATLLDADGAAFVVHAGPDDNKTDPSGNSGGRILCGVIEKIGK